MHMLQDSALKPAATFVDLGYRFAFNNPDVTIVHRGKAKQISDQKRKLLRRCQAIKPIIGHPKTDHRTDRCNLKGEQGDRLPSVLRATTVNGCCACSQGRE